MKERTEPSSQNEQGEGEMGEPAPIHDLDDVLPKAPFRERHTRRVELPIEEVWPALLACEIDEIAFFGPLAKIRSLPGRLAGRPTALEAATRGPMLEAMTNDEFDMLRHDDAPVDGRGVVIFGAVGKFWKPIDNTPVKFASAAEQIAFNEPGFVVIAASLEAVDRGDHVELITETRVAGTSPDATRKFVPYWALIRYPSGLIRRSWLAAIERTARGNTRKS